MKKFNAIIEVQVKGFEEARYVRNGFRNKEEARFVCDNFIQDMISNSVIDVQEFKIDVVQEGWYN